MFFASISSLGSTIPNSYKPEDTIAASIDIAIKIAKSPNCAGV